MSVDPALTSVVVPAYNAESTIGATLESIGRQTHRSMEVIVVDDGSTDDTARIVERFAARDGRVRLVRQGNGGVARARNAGFAESRGAYIAPIDADDLWHPRKLEMQLAALASAGPSVGFVYTYFRRIDGEGHVLYDGERSGMRGRAFLRHLLSNPVCNGSALLVRREAWESAGGYSPELHERGAQGCEDGLFQLLIARNWEIEVVPAFLTGYRTTPNAMSTNRERMRRSYFAMYEIVECRFPETQPRILALAQIPLRLGQAVREGFGMRPLAAKRALAECLRLARRCSLQDNLWVLRFSIGRIVGVVGPKLELLGHQWLVRAGILRQAVDRGPSFDACDPMEPVGDYPRYQGRHWKARIPILDDTTIETLDASARGHG